MNVEINTNPPLLRTESLSKQFGGFIATNNVSLSIPEGQLTALIGPNGAGKTTLIHLLTGYHLPSRGTVHFMGENVTDLHPFQRVRRGIGRSFQMVNIFPRLTVEQNITVPVLAQLGHTFNMVDDLKTIPDIHNRVHAILHEVGLGDRPRMIAGQLSHGDQRLLEIALALATEPTFLVLDEPTAGMNPVERAKILEFLKHFAKSGFATVFLVEHDMQVVFSLADHIIVLHQGAVFAEGTPEEISNHRGVREIYLGGGLEGVIPSRLKDHSTNEELLRVESLDSFYGQSQALHEVSLSVRRGEAVALLGRNGAGKTTTLMNIMGLVKHAQGRVLLRERNLSELESYEVAASGIALVPEGGRVFGNLTTRQNLEMPARILRRAKRYWTIEKVVEIFPALSPLMERKAGNLSGGERKMLAMGRALMSDPDVLLLDEPSEGLSPLVVETLAKALVRIREEGVTILMADQNLNFASRVTDRTYILEKGAVVFSGSMETIRGNETVVKKYLAV